MTPCTFADFYNGCSDKLTDIQLRVLDTEAEYFKMNTGYCGLLVEPSRVWISVLVGDMSTIRELGRYLFLAGIPLVGLACRQNSSVNSIAKYYGAKIEETGNTYADGATELRCLIDTLQTQRMKKTV